MTEHPRRVDAHHHVWDLAVRDQPWTAGKPALRRSFKMAELVPSLLMNHIDDTVLVQTLALADETLELLRLTLSDAHIVAVVGWVDLTSPEVGDVLAKLQSAPGGTALVGIRHGVQDEEAAWFDRSDVRRGLDAVAEADLVYELLVRPDQLGAAVSTVGAMPHVRFVLDHAGNPDIDDGDFAQWRAEVSRLANSPNVAIKLSGLVTRAQRWSRDLLRPYVEAVLETFGAQRVMFGSDWPVCLLAATYDEVVAAVDELSGQLERSGRTALFGGTATNWYGICA